MHGHYTFCWKGGDHCFFLCVAIKGGGGASLLGMLHISYSVMWQKLESKKYVLGDSRF